MARFVTPSQIEDQAGDRDVAVRSRILEIFEKAIHPGVVGNNSLTARGGVIQVSGADAQLFENEDSMVRSMIASRGWDIHMWHRGVVEGFPLTIMIVKSERGQVAEDETK